jgi:hypothetical protein
MVVIPGMMGPPIIIVVMIVMPPGVMNVNIHPHGLSTMI